MYGTARRSTTSSGVDSSLKYGTRLRMPTSKHDTARSSSHREMPAETQLEQRLRGNDTNNRITAERDSLKEQLKEVSIAAFPVLCWVDVSCVVSLCDRRGLPRMRSRV